LSATTQRPTSDAPYQRDFNDQNFCRRDYGLTPRIRAK
jgi:hypothetical protein